MHRPFVRSFVVSVLFFFILQTLSGPVFAQSVISGKVLSLKEVGKKQWEVVVELPKGQGKQKFLLDAATLVQAIVPAGRVAVGERVLVPPAPVAGNQGLVEMKSSPFANMPSVLREMLGLPDMPNLPAVPGVPNVPQVPAIPPVQKSPVPNVPKVPQVPQAAKSLPNIPNVPAVPPTPGKPGLTGMKGMSGLAASPGAPGGEVQEMGGQLPPMGGMPAEEEVRPPEAERPQPEPPKEARSSTIAPGKITGPTPTLTPYAGQKVVGLKKTANGLEMVLEGEKGVRGKQLVQPDTKVVRILGVKDLKKGMEVALEVVEEPQGQFVQRLTVL